MSDGGFYYDPHHDINDGKPWSEMDIDDLKASIAHGATLKETASFLCRAGTSLEVAEKAKTQRPALMPDRRGNGFDRRALRRSLAEAEERLANIERQIANQRTLIAKLDADGRDAEHAKRLLSGLEVLQSARRESRELLLQQLKSAT